MQIIGQVSCDAVLFMPPDVLPKPRRERPRTYGIKMTSEATQQLPTIKFMLTLYGKAQLIRLRTHRGCNGAFSKRSVGTRDAGAQVGGGQSMAAKRTVLELWMKSAQQRALVKLFGLVAEEVFPIEIVSPWRNKQPLTGGLVVQWLRMEFTEIIFRWASTNSPRYSFSQNNAATPD